MRHLTAQLAFFIICQIAAVLALFQNIQRPGWPNPAGWHGALERATEAVRVGEARPSMRAGCAASTLRRQPDHNHSDSRGLGFFGDFAFFGLRRLASQ